MDHIGMDVHKKECQICILAEGGELIEQRIRTEPERFAAVLGRRPRARERSQHKGALGAPEGGVAPSEGAHLDIIAHSQTAGDQGQPLTDATARMLDMLLRSVSGV